ncbi:hypothetical protein Golax_008866 [Gossypium laxum]|uniref:Uncharacterized protein n=1 Tax=Gossypium laxum TaxID=34288 RepID=A0A7J9AB61_9ROSI|nr:hypothetical protein [Gossypium laxum]
MATSLCKGVGSDDSFTEGDIKKSLVNAIPSIESSEKIQQILIKDMGTIVPWVMSFNPAQPYRKGNLTGGSQGQGFNLGKLAREGHGGQIGKFNALGYKGAAGSSGQLEKLGRVSVGSLGPNGDIALMSKTLHANVLLDKQPSQSFGPSVALEGENPSLLDQAVKVGGSHQAQLVDVEEIIRAS